MTTLKLYILEFWNEQVKTFLRSRNINHFRTLNEKKANFVERLIRTLKTRITRHMHHTKQYEWVKALPQITHSYNNTFHRSLQMTPQQAMKTDDVTLWNMQYNPKLPSLKKKISSKAPKVRSPYKYKEGDRVILTYIASKFDRAYAEKWTDEQFTVIGRTNKQGIPQYTIKDWNNDLVEGRFYEAELQKINVSENEEEKMYNIEKILKERKRNGKPECLVKWQGWHKKFNSWIPKSDVKDIYKHIN